jgi:PPOX class probable F420-dependent enzyme
MAIELPAEAKEFILGKNIGNLATLMPDGSPHVAPVWVDLEDNYILVNTAEGRQKVKNIRRDPRVAIDILNSKNPYEMMTFRGRVVEITTDGASEHIDKLSRKYLGTDYPNRQPGEQRVIVRIEPEKILGR